MQWFVICNPYIMLRDLSNELAHPATIIGPFDSRTAAGRWVQALPDNEETSKVEFVLHAATDPNSVQYKKED